MRLENAEFATIKNDELRLFVKRIRGKVILVLERRVHGVDSHLLPSPSPPLSLSLFLRFFPFEASINELANKFGGGEIMAVEDCW